MEEVLELADRVTVLRDGKYVGDLAASRSDAGQNRFDDGGPGAQRVVPARAPRPPGEPMLVVRGLAWCPGRRLGREL